MAGTVGELTHTRGELEMEWKVPDFFSLPDKSYDSPAFYFAGASWFLRVYPNCHERSETIGSIGLFVMRGDSGLPLRVVFLVGLMTADGKRNEGTRHPFLLERSELARRKSELAPSGAVTFFCCLRCQDPFSLGDSLFRRLRNLSSHLKTLLTGRKRTDVVLKVDKEECLAHRVILESRSSVFSAMFTHDTTERQTGIINIKDIPPDVMKSVLAYMYCGQLEDLSYDNVFDIFAAADKYDLQDLKRLCTTFMEKRMRVERVCEVMQFAELYNEQETRRLAMEYFKDNMNEVLETIEWKIFRRKNPEFSVTLLESAVKESRKKNSKKSRKRKL